MSATLELADKQIRRSPRRVLAIVLAALLSAMAITATGTFITSLNESLQNQLAAPTSRADVVVTSPTEAALAEVAAHPDAVAQEILHAGFGAAQVDRREVWFDIQQVPATESLRWMTLTSGEWPGAGEIVLTQKGLDALKVGVGDTVTISVYSDAQTQSEFTVAGMIELAPGADGSSPIVYASAADAATLGSPTELIVQTAEGADTAALVADLNASFGDADGAPEAYTAQQYLALLVDGLAGGTDLLATLFMIFVVIALLAASMVIRNTFQVLLAQRLRENGLLRLIGASGRQVQRTVLAEALLLGAIGAIAGLVVGVALGWGIAVLAGFSTGSVPLAWGWLIAALLVTVALTVFSAWAPARSASTLSPMAALSASATTDETTSSRRTWQWVVGLILTAAGIAGAIVSAVQAWFPLLIPAGIVLAIGLIIVVPLLVRAIMPLIARVIAGAGSVSKLAGENLSRMSRRTGTVVLAIALGGSLIIGMLTALQSASASLQKTLTEDFPIDLVVATNDGGAISSDVISTLTDSDATSNVAEVTEAPLESLSDTLGITSVAAVPEAWNGGVLDAVSNSELIVPTWLAEQNDTLEGSTVEVVDAGGDTLTLTVRASPLADAIQNDSGFEVAAIASEGTVDRLSGAQAGTQAWVIAADGKSTELMDEVTELQDSYATLDAYGSLPMVQIYEQIFAMVAGFVVGMLGLTVVISGIGLASVMALAVAERGREIALLRALGLTRGNTRRMVLIESVTLAGIGAAFSLVIGIPLGIAAAVSALGWSSTVIALPWTGIALAIAIALALGVIAGLGPAQRAVRIAPAQGLAAE
ncbi:ABC transporter permease [Gulosibacter molinativorax]|uniref:ABC3 transporter permease C-terminal domain-containing protein n=1 Tax=Gulosibacter molinativorax TaxID=256821 RepID=A0ABT7C765_9MICO|nr:FtsX-like permease family protein [Gulosibacter molinativorax]MDJ1371034.1 hypothetical protein [Gulosibacter molinativorax]QUY61394.1 Hypotetical protein [Gulosibacter molinativorax]